MLSVASELISQMLSELFEDFELFLTTEESERCSELKRIGHD